jgi:hypothetical protein
LDDSEFGLTLAVHMAALVAVDARMRGDRPPADMAGRQWRSAADWATQQSCGIHSGNEMQKLQTHMERGRG